MKFSDIPQLTRPAHYQINVSWDSLPDTLNRWIKEKQTAKLDIDPKFQRGHIWTAAQQIKYVEFKLRGGEGSNQIYFNCVGWMGSLKGPFVLVDGKQRITAVLAFLNNEIPAFGHLYKDYEDSLGLGRVDFIFAVNNLGTEEQVLQWYLEMNSGGTPHTKEELQKVKRMIRKIKRGR